jgi:phospholipase/carboxylesterase
VAALPAAVKSLKECGVTVEELLRPGLGHGIDEIGLARGGAFLRASFARAAR